MNYDTSPLSIDTLDAEPARPEDPVRFVPEDQNIRQTNGPGIPDSGPISQATVLSRNVGFDTFIEGRPATNPKLDSVEVPGGTKYRTWVFASLLAAFSAFAGGFAVYFTAAPASTVSVPSQAPAVNIAVTDVQPSDTFVVKSPSETAAEEPLVPHSPEAAVQPVRPAHLAKTPAGPQVPESTVETSTPELSVANGQTISNETQETPQMKQPEREAKVGAYVAEKPAGRKPLARCADGTYSFNASKAAACSGRGGVSEWMPDGRSTSKAPAKQAAYVLGPRGGCYYLDSSNKKVYVEKKYCQ
jgi:hypothetical protein